MRSSARRLAALCLLLSGLAGALPQPLKVAFQGRLLDPATSLPKQGPVDLTFNLYRTADPSDTSSVWTEVQTNVPLVNGVFSVRLGSVTPLSQDVLAHTSAYLGITVGTDSEMRPRQQLAMSAYAYTAAQLAGQASARVNAGASYSTFTASGSLDLQYGLDATTAVFTASGDTLYALQVSSGLLLSSGTLRVDEGSRGIDAAGTGITASTGAFTGAGAAQPSVTASSGVRVLAGTLDVDAEGGVLVQYGVAATTFSGNGADLSGIAPQVQCSSQTTQHTYTAATEWVVAYATITLSAANKDVLLLGRLGFQGGTASTTQVRLRRGATAGAACTNAGTLLDHNQITVTAAAFTMNYPLLALDSPGAGGTWSYCATINGSANNLVRNRMLSAIEVSSSSASGVFLP